MIELKNYQAPAYWVDSVHLLFRLHAKHTVVVSTVVYRRNPDSQLPAILELDGEQLELRSISLNEQELAAQEYRLHDKGLQINDVPEQFTLTIETSINPEGNTALEGLYRSNQLYCSQCEAQGFRRISYYPDRPDVMSRFHVRIEADAKQNPVLLSNGNPVAKGLLAQGRHWAEWYDPFPKPCYLFALVAGDLQYIEDQFTTLSGRKICLRIYTEEHHIEHCDHAMASLKRAMRWDEQCFGREYDLDLFMIVAVDDFNMGAMENKGLNIFNARLVFASPETASDDDYLSIESVIAHEYFHNWTGNRITCRDWFQLSLKEGLTVFRDQQFTADLHTAAVKRIEDVRLLRQHQFSEDASPMAHSIRPASYMEINNFYTATVYNKGAEVVRIYHTLLGQQGFRRGMDLYFERHDGQAVTTEDFLAAMADANQRDLSAMQTWYEQAGTPELHISMHYDEAKQQLSLKCQQSCPATPECQYKKPFLIPLNIALFSPQGHALALQLLTEDKPQATSRILLLDQAEHVFCFQNMTEKPIPSFLRGFSAPVKLHYDYSHKDNAFLMQYDDDTFNRWAAAQRLAMQTLVDLLHGKNSIAILQTAFASILNDTSLDAACKAEILQLPSETEIADQCEQADPLEIHRIREHLRLQLAAHLEQAWLWHYHECDHHTGLHDEAMQARKLKHLCLDYLICQHKQQPIEIAYRLFQQADTMSDQYAALKALAAYDHPLRADALHAFEQQWQDDTHVMDKWFTVQALSLHPHCFEQVQNLMQHPQFHLQNPNKVRALIVHFCVHNPSRFHRYDGKAYDFLAEQVLKMDRINPQMAARMVRGLMHWKHFAQPYQAHMRSALEGIGKQQGLSSDVEEIVQKSLLT